MSVFHKASISTLSEKPDLLIREENRMDSSLQMLSECSAKRRKSSNEAVPIGEIKLSLFFHALQLHVVLGRVEIPSISDEQKKSLYLKLKVLCSGYEEEKIMPCTSKESAHLNLPSFSALPENVLKISLLKAYDANSEVVALTFVCVQDLRKDDWVRKSFWLFPSSSASTPTATAPATSAPNFILSNPEDSSLYQRRSRRGTCPPTILQPLVLSPVKIIEPHISEDGYLEANSPIESPSDPYLASFVTLPVEPFCKNESNDDSRLVVPEGFVSQMKRAFSSPQPTIVSEAEQSPLVADLSLRPRCYLIDQSTFVPAKSLVPDVSPSLKIEAASVSSPRNASRKSPLHLALREHNSTTL